MTPYPITARDAARAVGAAYGLSYGLSYRRVLDMLASGDLCGERLELDWYVDRAALDLWITAHEPGRPPPRLAA